MRRWSHEETRKVLPRIRERTVRLVGEGRTSHPSQWAAIESIAAKIGCSAAPLYAWVRRHETDTGQRPGLSRSARCYSAPLGYPRHAAQSAIRLYVAHAPGALYVAFVIHVFARRIVGWRVSSSMHTDFVLDALE